MLRKYAGLIAIMVGLVVLGYGVGKKLAQSEDSIVINTVIGLVLVFAGVLFQVFQNKKK